MQKARRRVSAPTACGHTGSGSISTPSRGAFHRSLAVLCAIGLPGVFSLAGWAPLIPTGLPVSCRTQARREAPGVVPVRGCHPLRPRLSSRVPVRRPAPHVRRPTTPERPRPHRFGLLPVRSPLLGESIFLSPPAGTGMFRFPAFARIAACAPSRRAGCPIRTPPDLVPFADPRGVSPLTASFIASGSLGIHRVPFSCSFAHAAHNARRRTEPRSSPIDYRLQSTSRVSVLYLVSSSRCSLPLLLLSQHFNEQPFFSNGLQRYDFFSTLQIF